MYSICNNVMKHIVHKLLKQNYESSCRTLFQYVTLFQLSFNYLSIFILLNHQTFYADIGSGIKAVRFLRLTVPIVWSIG